MKRFKKKLSGLTPTMKALIVILILAALTLGYVFGIYIPTRDRMADQKREISEIKDKIATEEEKETKMLDMLRALVNDENYDKAVSVAKTGDVTNFLNEKSNLDTEFTKQAIPAYNNLSNVMRYLSEYSADVYEWSFKGLESTSPLTKDSPYQVRAVELSFKTRSYKKAVDAVDALYQCPYLTVVSNVAIKGTMNKSEEASVTLTVAFIEKK